MITIIIAIAAFLVGGFVGYLILRVLSGREIDSAKSKADKIVSDAKSESKEILIGAKDEALKAKAEINKDLLSKEKEIAELEKSLRGREIGLDKKFDQLEIERKNLFKKSDPQDWWWQELVTRSGPNLKHLNG